MKSEGYAMIQRMLVTRRTRRSFPLYPLPHLESILIYPQPEHSDEEIEQNLSDGVPV